MSRSHCAAAAGRVVCWRSRPRDPIRKAFGPSTDQKKKKKNGPEKNYLDFAFWATGRLRSSTLVHLLSQALLVAIFDT